VSSPGFYVEALYINDFPKLYPGDGFALTTSSNSKTFTITRTGFTQVGAYLDGGFTTFYVLRTTVTIPGVFTRMMQTKVVGIRPTTARLIIPVVTTQACRTKLYWTGPTASFRVYNPSVTDISATATYTYASGSTSIDMNLNSPGTWHIAIHHGIFNYNLLQNSTVNMTTFT
jgi:hypothetical protein